MFLIALSCQKKKEENLQTSNPHAEETQIKDSNNEVPSSKKVLNEFRRNTWYEGRIKDLDIWFYADDDIFAYYGYKSTQGASINLINKESKNNKTFLFETTITPNKETFEGFIDENGAIKGKWKSNNKIHDFELKPINYENPQSSKELLNSIADLKLPFKSNLNLKDLLKDYYQEKNFLRKVTNLSQLIRQEDISLPDGYKLEDSALFWGKMKVGENYVVIFQSNLLNKENNSVQIEHGAYPLSTEKMYFAVLFDNNGKVLDTRMLGNRGEDAYFLEFSFELNKNNEIIVTWTEYMREGGARIEADVNNEFIKVVGNNFK